MKRNLIIAVAFSTILLVSCGNKTKVENKELPKDTTKKTNNTPIVEEDLFAKYDSLNAKAVEKTEYLALISGDGGPDGAYIYFTTSNGDSLFAREVPDNIKWKQTDEDLSQIEPQFLNKKYKVTYKMQTLW